MLFFNLNFVKFDLDLVQNWKRIIKKNKSGPGVVWAQAAKRATEKRYTYTLDLGYGKGQVTIQWLYFSTARDGLGPACLKPVAHAHVCSFCTDPRKIRCHTHTHKISFCLITFASLPCSTESPPLNLCHLYCSATWGHGFCIWNNVLGWVVLEIWQKYLKGLDKNIVVYHKVRYVIDTK